MPILCGMSLWTVQGLLFGEVAYNYFDAVQVLGTSGQGTGSSIKGIVNKMFDLAGFTLTGGIR